MLVLSRKKSEVVIFFDKNTMGLIMVIGLVEEPSGRCRMGFHASPAIGIVRAENTTFRDFPFGKIMNLPFGTRVEMLKSQQVG